MKLIAIILKGFSEKYKENYFGALTFIIERFFRRVKRIGEKGLIIGDSLPNQVLSDVANKTSEYLKNEEMIIFNKHFGKLDSFIYPSIFFQNDEHSNLLQITDLICASLQFSVREFRESNPDLPIKNNEDLLKEMNSFIEKYWVLFENNGGSVSGWGIKTWD